ncbi:MAG: hypothetical protein ACM3JQ_05975 [Candidatus Eiseniibacteriota bacterium]
MVSNRGSYLFSGKVIVGISLFMALAALITFFSSLHSASPLVQLVPNQTNPYSSPNSKGEKVDRTFVLVQNEFGWNGTSGGPTITVTKGDVLQITIINAGNMVHNFGIAKISRVTQSLLKNTSELPVKDRIGNLSYNELSAMPCPGCQSVYSQAHIDAFMPPLSQQVIVFKATEAGNFKYFCMVRGHLWLGMIGDLNVQDRNQEVGAA